MSPSDPQVRRYRFLLAAIVISLALHAAGMISMVTVVAPGVAMEEPVASRAAFVADQTWRWRAGWVPWHLTAASDLLISIALCAFLASRADRRGLLWASAGLALTLPALAADQWGEGVMVTELVARGRDVAAALADGAPGPIEASCDAYLRREAWTLFMTGTCANSTYTLMSICWMIAAARAAGGGLGVNRWLLGVGALDWLLFTGCSVTNWSATQGATVADGYPGWSAMVAFNAVAFSLLEVWLVLLALAAGRAQHADRPATDAPLHRLEPPAARPAPVRLALRAAGRPEVRDLVRAATGIAPMPVLRSDIEDVVYLNWLVPAARAADLAPPPLRVHVLPGDVAAVSILTYRHGRFGPRMAGPLRALFPSPAQSNWRLYVEPEVEGAARDAVYFVKTCLDSSVHVAGARLMSDGLPGHLAGRLEHRREGDRIATRIEAGGGSAPDLTATVRCEDGAIALPGDFAAAFDGDRDAALRYLVEQNRAVSVHPAHGRLLASRIAIPIALADLVPARVEAPGVVSGWLGERVAGCEPFAFVVPRVAFSALGESWVAPSR